MPKISAWRSKSLIPLRAIFLRFCFSHSCIDVFLSLFFLLLCVCSHTHNHEYFDVQNEILRHFRLSFVMLHLRAQASKEHLSDIF